MTIERDWELKEAARALRNLDYFSMTDLEKSRLEKELKQQLEKSGMPVKEVDTTQDEKIINEYNQAMKEISGEMYQFPTGAKRSSKMPRYDLIPKIALDRLAQRFTGDIINNIPSGGALKYGEGNWEKGLPTSDIINHIINHITSASNHFRIALTQTKDMELVRGSFHAAMQRDDDLAAAMWGLCVLMHQEETAFFHDDSFPHAST